MAIDWNKAMSSGETKKKKSNIDWKKAGAYTDEELKQTSTKSSTTVSPQEWAKSKKSYSSVPNYYGNQTQKSATDLRIDSAQKKKQDEKKAQAKQTTTTEETSKKTVASIYDKNAVPSTEEAMKSLEDTTYDANEWINDYQKRHTNNVDENQSYEMSKPRATTGELRREKNAYVAEKEKFLADRGGKGKYFLDVVTEAAGMKDNGVLKTERKLNDIQSDIDRLNREIEYSKDYTQFTETRNLYNALTEQDLKYIDDIIAEQEEGDYATAAYLAQAFSGSGASYMNTTDAQKASANARKALRDKGYTDYEIDNLIRYRQSLKNAEDAAERSKEMKQMAIESPVAASVVSLGTNLMSPLSIIEIARANLTDTPVDPNSPFFAGTQMTTDIRSTVSQNMPSEVLSTVYNAGMSLLDSTIAGAATPSLGLTTSSTSWVVKELVKTANNIWGGSIVGMQALSSQMQDAARRGASNDDIVKVGAIAFFAETLSEAWSIGNFKGLQESGKRGLISLLDDLYKSAGVNVSEELATDIVNETADRYFLGDKSNYELNVQAYMRTQKPDGSYYTRKEAEAMAEKDFYYQLADTAINAAVQGVMGGAVHGSIGRAKQRMADSYIGRGIRESGMSGDVVKVARNNEYGDKEVQEWVNRINKTDKTTGETNVPDHILGGTYRAMTVADIKNRTETTTETKQTEEITPEQRVEMVRPTLERKGGKVVSVESVESVEDGKITVKGTDGKSRVLDTSKLSKQAQELWKYAEEHFNDAETVQAFVDGFDGNDIATYSRMFKATNDLAATGMSATDIQGSKLIDTSALNEKAFSSAVETGNRAINKKIGVVDRTTVPKTNTQKLTIKMMDTFGKKHGMNIVVVDTAGTAEGWYKASTNSMVIALDSSAGAISRVFGHETYHYVKSQDEVRAEQIEKFVIDTMTRLKGKEWVEAKINSYEDNVYDTYEKKVDEFVADQMFDVFNNERAVKEFVQKDMNFAQRVIAHIKSLIADIKNIYNNLIARGHDEISVWQKDIDALQKLNDMMLDALSSIEQRNALNTQEQQIADAFGDELGTIETNSDGDATLITNEDNNRSLYESSQSKKYESTLQEISDALVKEYPRSGQISSYKEFAKTLKEGTTKQKKEQKGKLPLPGTYDTTAGEDDVWYSVKRTVANNKKKSYNKNTYYNEFNSLAMQWRYQADTKVGDLNIVNGKGGFALLEATEDGYVEIAKGNWNEMKELKAKYELAYKDVTDTFYGNIEGFRIEQRRNIRNMQPYENRGNDDRGRGRIGEKRREGESPRSDEHSWKSGKEESVNKSTKRDPSISEDASNYILDTKEYQEVLSILDERMNLVTHKNLSPKAINYLAGKLLNKVKSNYSREQLTERLTALFDYIANSRDVSWEEITEIAAQISKDVLKQSSVLDRSMQKEYADVLKLMKETKVYISPEQKAEIKMWYGSYDAFRKLVGNKIGVTVTDTSAVPLDVFWRELSENRPEMFNAETNYLDMPAELVTFFEMTSPQYVNPYDGVEMDMDEASYDMALQIYDEYFNIPEVKTEAQKYALKEERLKGRYNAKIKDIHSTYRERIKKLRKEKNSKIEATKALYRQRHEDYRDKRNETDEKQKLRRQIVRETKKLTDMLINPKDDKHIPQELIIGINSFARAMTEHGAFPAQKAVNLQKAFKNIGEKANDPDFNLASMYDESIDEMLGNLSSILSDKRLGEMTVIELSQIKDIAKYFSHIVSMSNKAFSENIRENLSTLQTETLNEVESQSKDKKRMMTKMQVGLLKPVTFFELLESPTLDKLYTNIRKGEESWAKIVYDAKQKRIEAQKEYNYKEWADDKVEITTERDDKLSLTVKEALSVYALSKRNQGVDHIMVGGVVLEEEARKRLNKKNRFSKNKDKSVNVRSLNVPLSFNDIQNVNSMLTDEQKAYADELVKYMSSDMAKLGNEVSMRLYGIQKYTENYYFPIKSASNFLYSEPGVENDSRIKHMSMTKRTVPKANNPVVIGDFTETVMSHCQDMALYYGFALPLEDFKRVWNYKTPNIEGETHTSIKQQIDMVYGDKANKYIKQLLTDINGGVTKQAGADVVNKWIGLAKKTAVFASLSVAVQQPSAIARAMTYVDPKYFVGLHHKGTWEEIQKYAPVAIVKEMGYFDTGIGRQAVEWMTDTEYEGLKEKAEAFFKDGNFRDELMSMLPGYMDKISWGRLWVAVKNETKAKHPDLDVNSEEFLQACGERFTYVIDRTQVYDSVFSRSEWMRSKDTGVKVATAFMSEPLTAYNMLYKAAVESKKGNHKFAVRTLSAYVISVVFNSLLKSIITAMRDDDEEKSFWEKYIADFISNASDDVFGMIPYVKDAISILQGYESSRMDTQLFSNIADSVTMLFDSNKSPWEKVKTILGTVGMATGIPFKNVIRDAEMIIGGAKRVLDGNYKKTTATGIKYAIAEEYDVDKIKLYKTPTTVKQYIYAYLNDDIAHLEKTRNNLMAKYENDEKKVDSQIKTALGELYKDGDITKSQAEQILRKEFDYDKDELYWQFDKWDGGKDYSKYGEFYDAVESGKNLKVAIKHYTANGVEESDLASQITTHYKDQYIELYKTNRSEASKLKTKLVEAYAALGYKRADKSKDIDEWLKPKKKK